MKRTCAVCGSSQKRIAFPYGLVTPSSAPFHSGREAVICSECGFAYVDNLPEQAVLDKHYTHSYASSEEAARYDSSLQNILRFLHRGDRILDIGCGPGNLLSL